MKIKQQVAQHAAWLATFWCFYAIKFEEKETSQNWVLSIPFIAIASLKSLVYVQLSMTRRKSDVIVEEHSL